MLCHACHPRALGLPDAPFGWQLLVNKHMLAGSLISKYASLMRFHELCPAAAFCALEGFQFALLEVATVRAPLSRKVAEIGGIDDAVRQGFQPVFKPLMSFMSEWPVGPSSTRTSR